jgi:superfamily II DNA or RNA helicase
MFDIIVHQHNTTYIKLEFPDRYSISDEVHQHFSFFAEGYKFHPKYKMKVWDGKIKLFDKGHMLLPYGLLSDLVSFASNKKYKIKVPKELTIQSKVTVEVLEEFCRSVIKLPFEPRDYQLEAAVQCIRNGRRLIISPTGSGKSVIQYIVMKYLTEVEGYERVLLTVPTTGLVTQIYNDFKEYSQNIQFNDSEYLTIPNKQNIKFKADAKVIITTWQSIQKQDSDYFDNFDVLMCDEVHTMAADVSQQISIKSKNVSIKLGMTATLSNTKLGEMPLIGLFGPVYKTTTTADLIDQGMLANIRIKAIQMSYPNISNNSRVIDYADEISILTNSNERTEFISKLAGKLKGNTLVLFNHIEHGKAIFNRISELSKDKKVFYIAGSSSKQEREDVRVVAENNDDVIIVAGYAVFSTGVNIKNLHNLMFAAPSKSMIRILQSIGRVLRLHSEKDCAVVYDLYDIFGTDLSKAKNYGFKHFIERYKIYNEVKLSCDIVGGPQFMTTDDIIVV